MNAVDFRAPNLEELKKKYFVVDLHHHTRYSHDSGTRVKHILNQCEELGIYCAITDHNSISGVLKAFEDPRGKKWILPGIELCVKEGKDVLVYFYNVSDLKRWFHNKVRPHMKKHNSLRMNKTQYSMEEALLDLQNERCVVVLPHPCCARVKSTYHYFQPKKRQYLLNYVDAIEVINETMTRKNNLAALGWAMSLAKPFTAGSDGHRPGKVGEAVTYAKVKNKKEFLDAIKHGKTLVQGKEMSPNKRLMEGMMLVVQKARMRNNKKLDREFEEI